MKLLPYLSTAFIFLTLLSGCDNDEPEPVNDDAVIQQHLAANNLTATKSDDWEVYYIELEPGTGEPVELNSVVEIEYENALLDGQVISSDTNYVFVPEAYSFMEGVARGALTMSEGGKSLIFIPSVYAYGPYTRALNGVTVPPNAVIQSTITVKDVRTRGEQKFMEIDAIEDYLTEEGYTEYFEEMDGLFKQVLTEGQGTATPVEGSRIVINYEGSFLDGTVFDSGNSAQFNLTSSELIAGFYEGALTMKRDEETIFVMTSDLGYRDVGTGAIAPFTPLVFKIKMLEF